jgi:YfiH family protein
VVEAHEPWTYETRPHADAIVTREPSLAIGVSTADCGPVLFADPQARVIGAAHAGWRGALTGVLEATVEAMEKLGASRSRIAAAAGPMIHQPNYEVGPDLVERFMAADAGNARYFAPGRPGRSMFDLPGYVTDRLRRLGIGSVDNLALCTYGDPARFYSYRRTTHRSEPDYGRHVNAIALTG